MSVKPLTVGLNVGLGVRVLGVAVKDGVREVCDRVGGEAVGVQEEAVAVGVRVPAEKVAVKVLLVAVNVLEMVGGEPDWDIERDPGDNVAV